MDMMGDVIKKIRKDNCLTRTDLASRINVSYSALDHWENNRRDINIYNLVAILNVFKCNMVLGNGRLYIEDERTKNNYNISFLEIENDKVIYSYEGYGIINNKGAYSIVNLKTLTTPYGLFITYNSLCNAKSELHRFVKEDKFPILTTVTANTSGKIIFKEQVEELLLHVGCENTKDIIKTVGMKKQINALPIKNGCILKYGEKDGRELLNLILSSINSTFNKNIMDEVIMGYEGFLKATTSLTNGYLERTHQKHSFFLLIDYNQEYKNNIFKEDSQYDDVIVAIINQPIYKYGYPCFYEKVLKVLGRL